VDQGDQGDQAPVPKADADAHTDTDTDTDTDGVGSFGAARAVQPVRGIRR
jgi:hypothetical protein